MNRFLALLMVVMMVAGCRSRATPLSNPFLAPDRVPPPATRMPAPGTAVPYYDNGQSVAPPVIQQGSGSGTFSPGANNVPQNGPSSSPTRSDWAGAPPSRDVLPPSSQPVRPAVAAVPTERGISIPTDDRAARLAIQPVEITAPPRPELTPIPRPNTRSVSGGPNWPAFQTAATTDSTNNDNNSARWLRPGQYGTPRLRRGSSTPTAVPPAVAVAPANVVIPTEYPTGFYTNQAGAVAAAPTIVPGGCFSPCGQGFYSNGWQTVEISELPPAGVRRGKLSQSAVSANRSMASGSGGSRAGRWSRPGRARRSEPSGVRLASAERSVGSDQLLTTAADATPRTWARYGIGPRYEWLKGRLERSAATGQWKLRYIPIDGATDDYGGSVVIDNPRALGKFEPGGFVKISGSLDARRSDDLSFATRYRVSGIQPLAE